MDDADYASAHASHHSQVDHERLMGMQRGVAAKTSWENRIEDKCMQYAANIAMLNLNAMHMFAHGITAQNLMNPFDSMEEAYSGHDPLNGRSVGLGQAYVDFGESMVAFGVTSVGGIADTIGAGVENLAANTARLLSDIPSVGRNVASMFGRNGISNSIADEFDDALGISDKELTPGNYHLDPKDIGFTQPNAGPYFSNGSRIDDLIPQLRSGVVSPYDLPPIQVVQRNGRLFSIDNRRLLAFNAAGLDKIPVQIVSMDDPLVARKVGLRFDPIEGVGRYVVVVNATQRTEALQLLKQYDKIQGVSNGY